MNCFDYFADFVKLRCFTKLIGDCVLKSVWAEKTYLKLTLLLTYIASY